MPDIWDDVESILQETGGQLSASDRAKEWMSQDHEGARIARELLKGLAPHIVEGGIQITDESPPPHSG